MRPALPLLHLPLQLPNLMHSSLRTGSPRRPPTQPRALKSTWTSVVVPGTAPTLDADMVGVALLAAEARRRGGIMIRERGYVGIKGTNASPLLRDRVRMLEKDVNAIVKTMVRAKARVKMQIRMKKLAASLSTPSPSSISTPSTSSPPSQSNHVSVSSVQTSPSPMSTLPSVPTPT